MPPSQVTSDGSNLAQQQKTKTKKRWWPFRKAGPQDAASTAKEEKDVYKFRCCNSLVIIPHFHDVDGFSALVTSGLSLILLLIFFFAVFPQFKDAQRELERGANWVLANDSDDQWALCPDVWRSYDLNIRQGQVQFSNTTFPNISCLSIGEHPAQTLSASGALSKDAQALLGFMLFFYRAPGAVENASYWCYSQSEILDFFTPPQTKPSIRAAVTEPYGGCLSTSRNHTCITKALNMIANWDQTCTGVGRWGFTSRTRNTTAALLLKWLKPWALKDVLSFSYLLPYDNSVHVLLVVRMDYTDLKQRFDYVVPLAGSEGQSDAALALFNRSLLVLHSQSNESEWGYVYNAFLQTFQNTSEGAAMRQCLLRPNASIRLEDSYATPSDYQCTLDVDKRKWGAWQTAYSVYQQAYFKQEWPLVHMSLDYDVFFAYWTGLVGAFLSSIFAAFAFFAYFLAAVCHEGRELVKKHLRAETAFDRFPEEQLTRHESVGLLHAEAGLTGSPTEVSMAALRLPS